MAPSWLIYTWSYLIYIKYTKHKAQNSASAKGQQTNRKSGDTQWKETTLCADKGYMYETPKIHVYSHKETHCQYNSYTDTYRHISSLNVKIHIKQLNQLSHLNIIYHSN